MPRVICYQEDCLHNLDSRCRADEIEYDPTDGCLTMEPRLQISDLEEDEDDWGREGMSLVDESE